MSREEVQISDLEPSIIGEDVTKYAIQIRGVDGNGNEGPWSTILEYESPELLPSLQSDNYVEGQSGWFLDNDGTFEVNDGFIRGTLQSANYVTGVSGWALDQSGVVEFDQGVFRGALQIGTNTFRVDSNGNLSIGGSSASNAPFRVNTNGQILAMSIDGDFIQSRSIRANRIRAGVITANEISSNYIYSNTIDADQITAGTLNANNVTITGTLSAVTLNGVTGTFAGNLTASITTANAVRSAGYFSRVGGNTSLTSDGSLAVAAFGSSLTIGSSGILQLTSSGRITIDSNSSLSTRITGANFEVNSFSNFTGASFSQLVNFTGAKFSQLVDFDATIRNGGMTTSATGANVIAAGTAFVLRRESSSIRYKKNVRSAAKIENLLNARPVHFDTKDQEEDEIEEKNIYGAIAEEFEELGLRDLILYNQNNEPESIRYSHIGLAVIPYVKELYDRIEELERRLDGN